MSLTVMLQWMAQILTVTTGVWALFGETTATDPVTRRRRLTKSGYLKIFLIITSFLLYIATDRKNSMSRAAEAADRERQLSAQRHELASLRQLLLFQHDISSLQLSWPLTAPDYQRVEAAVRHARTVDHNAADPLFADFLSTAFQHGEVRASLISNSRPSVTLVLGRPQGLYDHRFDGPSPEWLLFEAAVSALTTDQFDLRSSNGTSLLSLLGRHWPCDVLVTDDRITFTLQRPQVRFADLDHATVYFEAADSSITQLPSTLTLRSLDPRFVMDTTLRLNWHRHVWRTYAISEDQVATVGTTRTDSLELQGKVLLPAVDTTSRLP